MSRTVFTLDEDLDLALRLADAISRERFLAQGAHRHRPERS
jgi:hypothetical protein